MILVVVNNVAMPPRMVPNASGINNFEGETFERRATPDTEGNNKDAAAILFIKRESAAEAAITPKTSRRSPLPNNRMMKAPIRSVNPERRSPSARMKAENMITTEARLNPENASCGVNIPLKPNARVSNKATMSARKTLPKSKSAAIPRNKNVNPICDIGPIMVAQEYYFRNPPHKTDRLHSKRAHAQTITSSTSKIPIVQKIKIKSDMLEFPYSFNVKLVFFTGRKHIIFTHFYNEFFIVIFYAENINGSNSFHNASPLQSNSTT
jgi:hypothetical protein